VALAGSLLLSPIRFAPSPKSARNLRTSRASYGDKKRRQKIAACFMPKEKASIRRAFVTRPERFELPTFGSVDRHRPILDDRKPVNTQGFVELPQVRWSCSGRKSGRKIRPPQPVRCAQCPSRSTPPTPPTLGRRRPSEPSTLSLQFVEASRRGRRDAADGR
jgi:hypothetical protein